MSYANRVHLIKLYLLTVGGAFSFARSKPWKTTERYLLPITIKVTDFKTHQYMDYYQRLSGEVNMPHNNITLDVGAATNAFKYL